MPELGNITYSRDECIAAIRDYYTFLTKMYLKESDVIEPPKEGWPQVTADIIVEGMGKTERVLDLLRHLPYIRASFDIYQAQGTPGCEFADWQADCHLVTLGKSSAQDCKSLSEGTSFSNDVPSHVIGLTNGGLNKDVFLLDTELGIVHWPECPGEIRYNPTREPVLDDPYDWAPENEADWRADAPAWAIPAFFEVLKDQFRELQFIPINEYVVLDVRNRLHEGLAEMLQEIYRAFGWPDTQRYRKRECLTAVRRALEERYPQVWVF